MVKYVGTNKDGAWQLEPVNPAYEVIAPTGSLRCLEASYGRFEDSTSNERASALIAPAPIEWQYQTSIFSGLGNLTGPLPGIQGCTGMSGNLMRLNSSNRPFNGRSSSP